VQDFFHQQEELIASHELTKVSTVKFRWAEVSDGLQLQQRLLASFVSIAQALFWNERGLVQKEPKNSRMQGFQN